MYLDIFGICHMVYEHGGAQAIKVGFSTYDGESIEMSVKHSRDCMHYGGAYKFWGIFTL